MGKLVLMREVIIERHIKIKYINVEEELMWLRTRKLAFLEQREYEIAGCLE